MNIFEKIVNWIAEFFQQGSRQPDPVKPSREPLPPIHFSTVNVVNKPPKNEHVVAGNLYCVVASGRMKWTLFGCPCGCGSVVTLSLQTVHSPFWKLTKMNYGRPTLYPSVWRDKGCFSHFWVKDGRIFWCADTGIHPSHRKI